LPAKLTPVQGSEADEMQLDWERSHMVVQTGDCDAQLSDTYWLSVDGVDRSEDFRRCCEESGYIAPESNADPAETLEQIQVAAEATNEWIACASDNGLSNLFNVGVTTVDEGVWPTVELTLKMTLEELRSLLDVCPNFDEEQARRLASGEDLGPDFVAEPDPYIVIELPEDSADNAHWKELNDLLMGKQ
jgi:hypothetical protein